jgi:hypothetical protein
VIIKGRQDGSLLKSVIAGRILAVVERHHLELPQFLKVLFQPQKGRQIMDIHGFEYHQALLSRDGYQFLQLPPVRSHRLFDNHMFSVLQRFFREWEMEMVWQGHIDRVHIGLQLQTVDGFHQRFNNHSCS